MNPQPRIVVITGATRGIGRNMAEHFSRHGHTVIGTGRNHDRVRDLDAFLQKAPTPGIALQADILQPERLKSVVDIALERFGAIHTWINNAAVFTAIGPTWEVAPDAWTGDLTTNLIGSYHGLRAVIPTLLRQHAGRIINIVGGGTASEFRFASAYGVSKTAVARLTENVAAELDGTGVLCFAMDPGFNKTDMTLHQAQSEAGLKYLPRVKTLFEQGKDAPPHRAPELARAIAEGRLDAFNGRIVGIYDSVESWESHAAGDLGRDSFKLRISKP